MRNTRYGFLVLLSSLLMLTGCSRRDILDDYPVSGVDIKLDWDGVTDQLPEGVRVIFYPKNGEGRKVDKYLSVRGGEMKVPPGVSLAINRPVFVTYFRLLISPLFIIYSKSGCREAYFSNILKKKGLGLPKTQNSYFLSH